MSEHTNESAGILNLAQKVHDDYVAEGQAKAERLVADAQTTADNLVSTARVESEELRSEAAKEADTVVSEAEKHANELVASAKEEEAKLETRIAALKKVEYEYRARLVDLANGALETLETHANNESTEEDSAGIEPVSYL